MLKDCLGCYVSVTRKRKYCGRVEDIIDERAEEIYVEEVFEVL